MTPAINCYSKSWTARSRGLCCMITYLCCMITWLVLHDHVVRVRLITWSVLPAHVICAAWSRSLWCLLLASHKPLCEQVHIAVIVVVAAAR